MQQFNSDKTTQWHTPATADVVIIGYGPVGAALATYLGKLGVDTLVIDKAADILPIPRAIALDNEALRVLQQIGLDDDSFEKIIISKVKMKCPYLGEFAEIDTSGQFDQLPKLVTFYQPDLEKALRSKVSHYSNVHVALSTEFISYEEQKEYLSITYKDPSGIIHRTNCKYLVAADGASSKIRDMIGQSFTGQSYIEDWLIVDANQRMGKAIDHVEFICDPQRPTPHMPAPGGRERWEFMLQAGETREEMEHPDKIKDLLKHWGNSEEINIERQAVYRFHARCCECFSKGRIFLVGDAAHITPPFVGQGLVAGLRDIANLGWKLSLVLKSQANPDILQSYDIERRPHARKMISLAKFMGHLVMPQNKFSAIAVHGAMKSLCSLPKVGAFFTELKVKPQNRFTNGLFYKQYKKRVFGTGGQLEQVILTGQQGNRILSDTQFSDHFVVLGFGVDPHLYIDQKTQQQWQELGGKIFAVTVPDVSVSGQYWLTDIEMKWMSKLTQPWVVIIRPDRIVLHEGEVKNLQKMLKSSLKLMV